MSTELTSPDSAGPDMDSSSVNDSVDVGESSSAIWESLPPRLQSMDLLPEFYLMLTVFPEHFEVQDVQLSEKSRDKLCGYVPDIDRVIMKALHLSCQDWSRQYPFSRGQAPPQWPESVAYKEPGKLIEKCQWLFL